MSLRSYILSKPVLRRAAIRAWSVRDGFIDPQPAAVARSQVGGAEVVLLGPWAGEVGPEYVYWIGFLEVLKQHGVFKDREIVAISRGGVQSWYSSVAGKYLDLLDLMSAEEFKALRSEQPTAKQRRWTPRERSAIEAAKDRLNLRGRKVAAIHPGLMWEQVLRWIRSRRDLGWLLERVAYVPFGTAPTEIREYVDQLALPPRFQFVRFYSSKLFPWTERAREFCRHVVSRLAERGPVVTMGLTSSLDDHEHLTLGKEVVDLSDRLPFNMNLGVQTETLRRSEGYFGTYGGLSVLPAFVGKPSLSFYAAPLRASGFEDIHFRHEAITTEIFRQMKQTYQVVNLDAWEMMQSILNSNPNL